MGNCRDPVHVKRWVNGYSWVLICVAYVKRWVNGDSWVLMCATGNVVTGEIRDRSKWIFVKDIETFYPPRRKDFKL